MSALRRPAISTGGRKKPRAKSNRLRTQALPAAGGRAGGEMPWWRGWGRPLLCVLLMVTAAARFAPHPRQALQALQRVAYPLQFRELLLSESQRAGVDPTLVAAVVLQESGFQPAARSPVGAQGLMQLMPDTAAWVHTSLVGGNEAQLDLCDPRVSLRLGSSYLAYLEQRFGGEPIHVLAAYNAGPSNVVAWLGEKSENRLQVSDIPFGETRNYVKAVLRNQRSYRQLYPELSTEPSASRVAATGL